MPDAETTDRGFTLVELLIALVIMAIVMVALAPAFYGNLKAASATNYRSSATGLAVAAVEQLRGFPYFEVGYDNSTDDPQVCQTSSAWNPYAGQLTTPPVENVTGSDAKGNPYSIFANQNDTLSLPLTKTIGSVTYSINRCVYWAPSSTAGASGTPGETSAYKLSWVGVQWKTDGLTWHVTQTSAIYPGGEGQYLNPGQSNGVPFTPNCQNGGTAPSTPRGLTAAVDPTFPTTAVDLTWSEGTSDPISVLPLQYQIDYETGGSGQWVFYADTGVPGTSNNPFVVDGLVPGTAYSFQVNEVACDGTPGAATAAVTQTTSGSSSTTTTTTTTTTTPSSTTTTTVAGSTTTTSTSTTSTSTTTTSVPTGCTPTNFAVSPATGATINNNGVLTGSQKYFVVSVNVNSACTGVAVEYTPTNSQTVTDAYSGSATSGILTWQTTATQWAEGSVNFNLFIAGKSSGYSFQVTIACANGKTC